MSELTSRSLKRKRTSPKRSSMKRSRRRSRAAARPSMRNARVDVAAVAVVADAAGTARIARNMLTGKLVMLVKLLLRRTKKIDRKSVVSGKSVSVRVALGGRRIIKKKKEKRT